MGKCGKCGSKDIFGGSWAPDKCRTCGAIDAGNNDWYYDTDSGKSPNEELLKEMRDKVNIFDGKRRVI